MRTRQEWKNIDGIAYIEDEKVKTTRMRPLIQDLDELPFMATDFLEELQLKHGKNVTAYLVSSRGCYKNCSFYSMYRCFSQHYVLHSLTHNEGFENFFWTFEFFGLGSYRIDIWMDPNQRMQAVYLDWKNGEFHRFHQELFRHSRNRCQE